MVNILLADDHAIIRAGLKIFIENYIAHSSIDEAVDGESAFEKIKEKDYNLLILDVNMPNTDSFGLVSIMLKLQPELNILMFSMNAEEIYAKKYLQLGAKGYLSKASPENEIKSALDTVLNGKRYISSALNQALTNDAIANKSNNPFDDLSPREFEIVQYLIKGKTLTEICTTLNLQTSTVGTHKARIFDKLHCTNIIDLHSLAKIYNIIPSV